MTDGLNMPSEPSSHPLQSRLKDWEQTQFDFKMESLRRLFGTHEPVKRVMELEAVNASLPLYPDVLRRADVVSGNGAPGARTDPAREILLGRDGIVDWEDIYGGRMFCDVDDVLRCGPREAYTNECIGMDESPLDFHTDFERRIKI
ncbi:hypothetical protein POJ06DRAFT_124737 [Lipomyces tetrasporus]|uniref:Proteasome maturation factor UMP1 n=1 Tax=Lipomyces tetrasporus TaxID=54092 RepID=A0AAD7VRJ7_9ASCO|nr:uncharacterized protein POJ06DRAFT_124737 [Lipomyces tetrasporus]KAJ8100117.1 hypothetical protein POJ06DRAFT_124737 [Lipomyces tetrasporus]